MKEKLDKARITTELITRYIDDVRVKEPGSRGSMEGGKGSDRQGEGRTRLGERRPEVGSNGKSNERYDEHHPRLDQIHGGDEEGLQGDVGFTHTRHNVEDEGGGRREEEASPV